MDRGGKIRKRCVGTTQPLHTYIHYHCRRWLPETTSREQRWRAGERAARGAGQAAEGVAPRTLAGGRRGRAQSGTSSQSVTQLSLASARRLGVRH